MLNTADLVKALGLASEYVEIFEKWNYPLLATLLAEEKQQALSALEPGFIAGKLVCCPLPGELPAVLEDLAGQIRVDPALRDYFVFCNALTMHNLAESGKFKPQDMPYLEELLGFEKSRLFDILLYFAASAQWFETYRRLGIPERYAAAPLKSLPAAVEQFRLTNGCPGYPRKTIHWLAHYVHGILFRIGRFEYMVRETVQWLPLAFRSIRTGRVVMLARNNWAFQSDGLRLPLDEPFAKSAFTSKLLMNGKVIRGTYIDPRGFAVLEKELELDPAEYKPMWQPGELTGEIHIPGGGGMTMERCQASLKEARDFFPEYLGWKSPFFWCISWVFNPDIAAEMPGSNIDELQKRVYLAPRDSTRDAGLGFVFGRSDGNWLDYPEDTSLRRAFKRLIRKGVPLKNGCMLIDDAGIDAFEAGFYRQYK